jgi:transglutaminase-like putative cysteine protease
MPTDFSVRRSGNPARPRADSPHYVILAVVLLGALACSITTAAPTADAPSRESWDILSMSGAKVGYAHAITRTVAEPEPEIVSSIFCEMRIKRFGVTLSFRTTEEYHETLKGALLRATSAQSGALASESEAKIQGAKVIVTTHTGGTTHVTETAWDAEAIGPEAQSRRLRESGFPIGKAITFKMYMLELQKVVTSTITIEGRETVTISGQPRELYKASSVMDALPGMVTRLWLDETGDTLKSVTDLMGGVETLRATREEALAVVTSPSQAEDLAKRFAIVSNVKFEHPAAVKEVLYRIEGPIERLKFEDRRQKIESRGPGWVLLRVKALNDAAEPSAEKPGPECLAASAYLQSDDPEIQRIARDNVTPSANPEAKAKQLAAWVFKNITRKDYKVGFASAKETVLSREGDCKEHAMLLAALLRAARIPSRVDIGVTYWKGQFFGHMWTEAFLNDWTALDATLTGDVVDATHIRLVASAMDGPAADASFIALAQVFGNLKIIVQESR